MTKIKTTVIPTSEFKEEFESYKKDVLKCVLKLFKCDPNWNTLDFVGTISEKDYKSIRKSVRIKLNKDCNYTITDEQLKSILISLDADLSKPKLLKYKFDKLREGGETRVFVEELSNGSYYPIMTMWCGNVIKKIKEAKRIVAILNKNS